MLLEVERLLNSQKTNRIIIATTDSPKDDKIGSILTLEQLARTIQEYIAEQK